MNTKDLTLSQTEIHKLLSAGSGDAALLHLYLQCGNAPWDRCLKRLRELS